MNHKDIMKKAEDVVTITKKGYNQFHRSPPIFHVCYKTGELEAYFLQEMFSNDRGKDAASVFMRSLVKNNDGRLEFVIFTVEAWIVFSPTPNISVPPSQHPDRKEVLQFILETPTGIWNKLIFIENKELTKEEDWKEMGNSGGRMGSFGLVDKTRGMYT